MQGPVSHSLRPGKARELAGYTERGRSGCSSRRGTHGRAGSACGRHRIPIMTPNRWKKAAGCPVHLIAF